MRAQVREVQPGTAGFELVLALAARVLAQDRYLVSRFSHARESHVLGAFDRILTDGATELVLVSGYAGIGKSSLVNELQKALSESRSRSIRCMKSAGSSHSNAVMNSWSSIPNE